jgi:hypothetical protein
MPKTVTLPLINDEMTIEAVFERLRDMKCGGFVLGDPKGSRVVTASALGLIQKAGDFNATTKIADLRERIFPTWTEPQGLWDRVRGRVSVGGVSVPRELAERPQEGYAILEIDRKNQLATVLANDPRQLEELLTPPG